MKKDEVKKIRCIVGRSFAVLALFAVLTLCAPTLRVGAVDFNIDASNFLNLNDNVDSVTIWYWHQGMPPVSEKPGVLFPVLLTYPKKTTTWLPSSTITWHGIKFKVPTALYKVNYDPQGYYWRVYDNNRERIDYQWHNKAQWETGATVIGTLIGIIANQRIAVERQSPDGSGAYDGFYDCQHPYYFAGNTRNLDFFTGLEFEEDAVTFSLPDNLPFLVGTGERDGLSRPLVAIGLNRSTTLLQDQNTKRDFLTGQYHIYSYVSETLAGHDNYQNSSLDWVFDYRIMSTKAMIGKTNTNYLYHLCHYNEEKNRDSSSRSTYGVRTVSESQEGRNWIALSAEKTDNTGVKRTTVRFWTEGTYLNMIERESSSWYCSNKIKGNKVKTWKANIAIQNDTDGYILTNGRKTIDDASDFYVYHAVPELCDRLNMNFVVQKGQVSNLDGPIILPEGRMITVQDGGTLSIKGWVINNGTINIQPGGTLIVQNESCLNSLFMEGGHDGGTILCDGLMVILGGGKVVGGGITGIKFGEGAQCVNYGDLMSERMEVYTSYTIENRGDKSRVFFGWGVGDSGYPLSRQTDMSGDTYKGKGYIESFQFCNCAKDAVYGKGKDRVYYNQDSPSHNYRLSVGGLKSRVSLNVDEQGQPIK